MGHGGEFWQNVIHWRREWKITSVFLPWKPHEIFIDRIFMCLFFKSIHQLFLFIWTLSPLAFKYIIQPLWGKAWTFLEKLKIELTYDPEISLLGLYLEKSIVQKDISTPKFIAALFTIAGISSNLNIHQLFSFSLVTQSCPTLCDTMDCSMPGLPVHRQLPECTQTHVYWVSDAIQPSHPLSSPSLPALNFSQH